MPKFETRSLPKKIPEARVNYNDEDTIVMPIKNLDGDPPAPASPEKKKQAFRIRFQQALNQLEAHDRELSKKSRQLQQERDTQKANADLIGLKLLKAENDDGALMNVYQKHTDRMHELDQKIYDLQASNERLPFYDQLMQKLRNNIPLDNREASFYDQLPERIDEEIRRLSSSKNKDANKIQLLNQVAHEISKPWMELIENRNAEKKVTASAKLKQAKEQGFIQSISKQDDLENQAYNTELKNALVEATMADNPPVMEYQRLMREQTTLRDRLAALQTSKDGSDPNFNTRKSLEEKLQATTVRGNQLRPTAEAAKKRLLDLNEFLTKVKKNHALDPEQAAYYASVLTQEAQNLAEQDALKAADWARLSEQLESVAKVRSEIARLEKTAADLKNNEMQPVRQATQENNASSLNNVYSLLSKRLDKINEQLFAWHQIEYGLQYDKPLSPEQQTRLKNLLTNKHTRTNEQMAA